MTALVPRRRKTDWMTVPAEAAQSRRIGTDAPVAPFLSQLIAEVAVPEPTPAERLEARSANAAYAKVATSTISRLPAGYRKTVLA